LPKQLRRTGRSWNRLPPRGLSEGSVGETTRPHSGSDATQHETGQTARQPRSSEVSPEHQLEGRMEKRKKDLFESSPDGPFVASPSPDAAATGLAASNCLEKSPRGVTANAQAPAAVLAAEPAKAAAAPEATPEATPEAIDVATDTAAGDATALPDEPKPLPLLQVCTARNNVSDQALLYLWRHRSSAELACDIERALMDFDALAHECDVLFREYCSAKEAVAADATEESSERISAEQLHHVTQRLIDVLGSRSPAILERIGQIYELAASGSEDGIGAVQFRGYVASVLTQILRELQERPFSPEKNATSAGPREDIHQREPQEEVSDEYSLLEAGSSFVETMQGWFSSAATAIAGLGEGASADIQPKDADAVDVHPQDAKAASAEIRPEDAKEAQPEDARAASAEIHPEDAKDLQPEDAKAGRLGE